MAWPRTCRNAGGASTNNSGTPEPIPAVFCAPTSAPAQALAPAPASVSGPLGRYMDEDLQRATKLALQLFVKGQEHGQTNSAPRDRALKAQNPDLYYRSLHIECYYFCRQCEDYFDTAGAKSHKRVPFAASFLRDQIYFRWQQHKTQVESDNAVPPTWDKFKAFFQQSLGESTWFVTSIWIKIKRDS